MHKRTSTSPLRVAFVFSTLFHLSMVTVFSIVIYFPRHDIEYLGFELVEARPTFDRGTAKRLRLSSGDPYAEDGPGLQQLGAVGRVLPDFRLPTLEFSELKRLQLSQETRSHYGELFPDRGGDSWSFFTGSLRKMRLSLSNLGLPGGQDEETLLGEAAVQIIQPFPSGFLAYIEWNSGSKKRKLISTVPITALDASNPEALEKPIEVVFKVNADGRVINVWSPQVDDNGMIDSIQMAVLAYRFAAMPAEVLGDEKISTAQMGTLHLARDRGVR